MGGGKRALVQVGNGNTVLNQEEKAHVSSYNGMEQANIL